MSYTLTKPGLNWIGTLHAKGNLELWVWRSVGGGVVGGGWVGRWGWVVKLSWVGKGGKVTEAESGWKVGGWEVWWGSRGTKQPWEERRLRSWLGGIGGTQICHTDEEGVHLWREKRWVALIWKKKKRGGADLDGAHLTLERRGEKGSENRDVWKQWEKPGFIDNNYWGLRQKHNYIWYLQIYT